MPNRIRFFEIDRLDLEKREIPLAILGRADLAFDRIAGAKPETPDLVWRDIDIIRPGKVI